MAGGNTVRGTGGFSKRRAARRRARTRRRTGAWLWFLCVVALLTMGGFFAVQLGLVGRDAAKRVQLPILRSSASREVNLYFADPRWSRLLPEVRRIPASQDAAETIQALVAALAEGPTGEAAPVLPQGTSLRGAYLGADGLAVVDFDRAIDSFRPGGASGEILSVFALVHTIVENLPEIRSVQILVGGKERETLAGHVKISEPLVPDPQWNVED